MSRSPRPPHLSQLHASPPYFCIILVGTFRCTYRVCRASPPYLSYLLGLSYLCLQDCLACRGHSWLSALREETFFFGVSAFWHSGVPTFWCSGVLMFRRSDVPTFWYADVLICWRSGVLILWRFPVLPFWQASTLDFARRFQVIARKAAVLCLEMYSLFYEHTERSINAILAT